MSEQYTPALEAVDDDQAIPVAASEGSSADQELGARLGAELTRVVSVLQEKRGLPSTTKPTYAELRSRAQQGQPTQANLHLSYRGSVVEAVYKPIRNGTDEIRFELVEEPGENGQPNTTRLSSSGGTIAMGGLSGGSGGVEQMLEELSENLSVFESGSARFMYDVS